MSKRNPKLLIEDIVECIDKINSYTEGKTFDDFKNDPKTIDAVVRNLEIIGEAANHVPNEIKQEFPFIKWRQIIGLRNRVIHEYFGVDLQIIWQVIKSDLERFEEQLQEVLSRI